MVTDIVTENAFEMRNAAKNVEGLAFTGCVLHCVGMHVVPAVHQCSIVTTANLMNRSLLRHMKKVTQHVIPAAQAEHALSVFQALDVAG